MNYFFYNLNTQFENTGDLLINKSLVDLLSEKGIVYIADKGKPEGFVNELLSANVKRLSELTHKDLMGYLAEMLERRNGDNYFLVLVPGDLSRTNFKAALATIKGALRFYKLKRKGVKVIRIGISLGKLENFNGYAESFLSGAYHSYAVRDKGSLSLAKKYKFSNLSYFPDLAWSYSWKKKPSKVSAEKDYIVLSFRSNVYGMDHHSDYLSSIITKLKQILTNSELSNFKIVVSYQVMYDRHAAAEIAQALSGDFDTELLDRNLKLEEALNLYYNAKVVISNRLHVLLLAVLADTLALPFINLIENKKITGIFNDNHMGETILNQKDDNSVNVVKIGHILNEEKKWIESYRLSIQRNVKDTTNYIAKILGA